MSRDDAYLLDMLIAARKTREFTAGRTWQAFSADEVLQTAVLHLIQVTGEGAANVSPATRDQYAAIPWRSLVGMRNLLVHRYWDIDLAQIWEVVTVHLLPLIDALESGLASEDET